MGVEIGAALLAAAPYISAASMAIGAGSAVASYSAQQQQAKEQQKANDATARSALTARNNQFNQLEARRLQERDAASERIFESRVEALRGVGAARAAGAAGGVEGNTLDALARDYWAAQGRTAAAISKTQTNLTQQLEAEKQGAQAQYESRLNASPSVREPSLWGLGLGITSAVASGAREELAAERARPGARQPEAPRQ